MATYLILNLIFMAVVIGVMLIIIRPRIHIPSHAWLLMVAILLVLTIIFDSLIVGYDIVAYDKLKILNIRLGYAPIEDLSYAVLAAILIPAIWYRLKK